MDLEQLERTLSALLERGERIACIIATMGTEESFGIDNLEYVVRLRDRLVGQFALPYRPHVHADAVIGWAWSVFNDYNYGPVTLFRVYPPGVDPRATYRREVGDPEGRELLLQHNEYNRQVFEKLRDFAEKGRGPALSLTERYRVAACGVPILALRSCVMTPFAGAVTMDDLLRCVDLARRDLIPE